MSVRELAKLLKEKQHHSGYPIVANSKKHSEEIFLGLITDQELYGLFSDSEECFQGPEDDGSKVKMVPYDTVSQDYILSRLHGSLMILSPFIYVQCKIIR